MTGRRHTVGWRERALASASIGCGVILVAAFAARNVGLLVVRPRLPSRTGPAVPGRTVAVRTGPS
jgi:hypothetical protein